MKREEIYTLVWARKSRSFSNLVTRIWQQYLEIANYPDSIDEALLLMEHCLDALLVSSGHSQEWVKKYVDQIKVNAFLKEQVAPEIGRLLYHMGTLTVQEQPKIVAKIAAIVMKHLETLYEEKGSKENTEESKEVRSKELQGSDIGPCLVNHTPD
jgi:hypothetical protein